MKWMKERDLLIAQTMAFVQSISGKKPENDPRAATRIDFTPAAAIEKADQPIETAPIVRPAPMSASDVRQEIQSRVAAFRAHQQLFHRERDEYFKSVLGKARDSIDSAPKPPGN